jgi:hypothetical protein
VIDPPAPYLADKTDDSEVAAGLPKFTVLKGKVSYLTLESSTIIAELSSK